MRLVASRSELRSFAESLLTRARDHAIQIALSENAHDPERYERKQARASAIEDEPALRALPIGTACKAWAVIVSIDLRKSSQIALSLGAKNTYELIHTFLPTMIHVIGRAGGVVVNLRGDGMIAAFGFTRYERDDELKFSVDVPASIGQAVKAGQAIHDTMKHVLDPLLREYDISPDPCAGFMVGVGIDLGPVVATRVGYATVDELTAYGDAVNQACKLHDGNGETRVTKAVSDCWGRSKDGKIKIYPVSGLAKLPFWRVEYPHDPGVLD